jgi:hypothetical protein
MVAGLPPMFPGLTQARSIREEIKVFLLLFLQKKKNLFFLENTFIMISVRIMRHPCP